VPKQIHLGARIDELDTDYLRAFVAQAQTTRQANAAAP
jgi:hypothetical protein